MVRKEEIQKGMLHHATEKGVGETERDAILIIIMIVDILEYCTYTLAMRRFGLSFDSLSNVSTIGSLCKSVSSHCN